MITCQVFSTSLTTRQAGSDWHLLPIVVWQPFEVNHRHWYLMVSVYSPGSRFHRMINHLRLVTNQPCPPTSPKPTQGTTPQPYPPTLPNPPGNQHEPTNTHPARVPGQDPDTRPRFALWAAEQKTREGSVEPLPWCQLEVEMASQGRTDHGAIRMGHVA